MSADVIAREAARWWLLAHEGKRDEHAFSQWLQADPRNGAQYQHLQRLWDAGAQVPSVRRAQHRQQRRMGIGAAALCVLLAVTVLGGGTLQPRPGQVWQTIDGQTHRITLSDGSQAMLSARTRLRADITATHRQLDLRQGQAWFQVAADAGRPFQVRTPHGTVTALGTAFDIQVGSDASVVTVSEHQVRIDGRGAGWIAVEGEQLRFDGKHAPTRQSADPAVTAWQEHRVLQVMQPLAAVTHELDRWDGGHTLVVGERLRARRVSVIGKTTEAGASRDALASELDVRVIVLGPRLQVWLSRDGSSP